MNKVFIHLSHNQVQRIKQYKHAIQFIPVMLEAVNENKGLIERDFKLRVHVFFVSKSPKTCKSIVDEVLLNNYEPTSHNTVKLTEYNINGELVTIQCNTHVIEL
jgi:hypothetical protein